MNYQKIYDQIIERARSEVRKKKSTVYYEAHHIIPRCLGGEVLTTQWKTHPNIVLLTAREHFLCHWLLVRLHSENAKLIYALWMMCNTGSGTKYKSYSPSSRAYEESKNLYSKELKKKPVWNMGKLPSKKGISQTKEHIEKRIKAHKGTTRTEEARSKMSEARKGKIPWNKGLHRSEEQNRNYKKPVRHKETGATYSSINEASLAFKCTGQTISNRLKKGIFEYT